MLTKQLVVFASSTPTGGGSGFRELIENSRTGVLDADIPAVYTNHPRGGVSQIAEKEGITCWHFDDKDLSAEHYQYAVNRYDPDLVALSGWNKRVRGLDPRMTINIHPGPRPAFGGQGMFGHHVHEAVMAVYKEGRVAISAVSMHFVTEEYDQGPIFFNYPVLIRRDDTPETLAARVNKIEHGWQSYITNLVIQGLISWDGVNPASLVVPDGYIFHQPLGTLGFKIF